MRLSTGVVRTYETESCVCRPRRYVSGRAIPITRDSDIRSLPVRFFLRDKNKVAKWWSDARAVYKKLSYSPTSESMENLGVICASFLDTISKGVQGWKSNGLYHPNEQRTAPPLYLDGAFESLISTWVSFPKGCLALRCTETVTDADHSWGRDFRLPNYNYLVVLRIDASKKGNLLNLFAFLPCSFEIYNNYCMRSRDAFSNLRPPRESITWLSCSHSQGFDSLSSL